ncbi:hypothetical protein [Chryseobacterium luquanense]|uniref:YD repeat-containing protein n=1 Tax=Chryseobacterium luquanense TaxID=2983766 RepID=A0ABT3Y1Z1_9FLAO|nr:hypothetical protein [Chryseobacterium luquanense]MCX8532086.1 hypothetical protein [Chryseobacterium luquanense]
MRKIHLLTCIFILSSTFVNGQALGMQNITTDLPQIIPPSPTVSSLMKFEEVPVSHYTGVPDISIPLISVPSNSKDISINISLKYHTSSVSADEISSDVGLGWNLFAGGTVSRTVKGHPDEELILASSNKPGKIGIYQTTPSDYTNNFYYFSKNLLNDYKTYYKPNLSASDQLIANEFIWTANRTDKYDTEQDLWQFNFFGRTGRFYIKKNDFGVLEIVPLDHYNIKIINHYDGNTYKPTGFTIFDDRGYSYLFDIIEVSNNSGGVRNYYYDNDEVLTPIDHLFEDKEFSSSFHLSKVIDSNNNTLVEYHYNENEIKEGFTKATYRVAEFGNLGNNLSTIYKLYNICGDFPPVQSFNRSSTTVRVKKLSQIDITGIGKIKFNYQQDREDTNLILPETASSLKSVTLLNWNNSFIKKYNFTQEYRTVLEKRMFLSKIEEIDKNNQIVGNYKFSYENNDFIGKRIGKDSWGYFNAFDECDINTSFEYQRNTNPAYSTTDILQKITYPTGGATIFDFESNQYSYIANNLITDFSENKPYTPLSTDNLYFHKNSVDHVVIPMSTSNRKAVFYSSIVLTDLNTRKFSLEVYNGTGWEVAQNSLSCPSSIPVCCLSFILEKNKTYRVKWSNLDVYYNGTDILGIHYFSEDSVENNFLYGGGNRIRRIGYFDSDTPADYYKSINNGFSAPAQEKKYIYTYDNNTTLSSGSLVDPKPLFRYTDSFSAKLRFGPYNVGASCGGVLNSYNFSCDMVTTENNIPLFKTQGSAVGYKYITVEEGVDKGKITYEYTSPLDFQNSLYPQGPPFVQPKDFDYKRGNLIKQTVYDNNSRKLSEVENTYAYDDYEEFTGVKFTKPNSIYNGTSQNYPQTFAVYQQLLNSGCMMCNGNYSTPKEFWGGMPMDSNTPNFIPVPVFEAYGWTKLMSTKTTNYFYENGAPRILEKNESFEYNPLNKQISQHIAKTEDGGILKTKYFYHSGNSLYSQNRISEIEKIESYKDGELLDTKKINYGNSWTGNVSYLPNQIQSSFGNATLETQVTFDQYDAKGNILQYTTKDGISTAIVWGYNRTQPIAKVTGATYTQVSSLAVAIITASDLDASNPASESALISALDAFRKYSALSGYQITTYTYDPLIGVTSTTLPSGLREIYLYDSANRLKEVKQQERDSNGTLIYKTVKEYNYNYKQ